MATITIEATLWQLLRKSLRAGKPLPVAELRTLRRPADKYLQVERAIVMGLFAAKTVPFGTRVDDVPVALTDAGRRAAEYGETEVDTATFAALDTVRGEITHARFAARLGAEPSLPSGTLPPAPNRPAAATRQPKPKGKKRR